MRSATPCFAAFRFATASASGEISVAVTWASFFQCARLIAMHPDPVPMSSTVGAVSGFKRLIASTTSVSVSGRGTRTPGSTSNVSR